MVILGWIYAGIKIAGTVLGFLWSARKAYKLIKRKFGKKKPTV
ncbi:hypothetical protein [Brevibacillus dissolubilis]|nr:hypothetical protein [Brevibacillus dissolubilis]